MSREHIPKAHMLLASARSWSSRSLESSESSDSLEASPPACGVSRAVRRTPSCSRASAIVFVIMGGGASEFRSTLGHKGENLHRASES